MEQRCSNCGNKLSAHAHKCPRCGAYTGYEHEGYTVFDEEGELMPSRSDELMQQRQERRRNDNRFWLIFALSTFLLAIIITTTVILINQNRENRKEKAQLIEQAQQADLDKKKAELEGIKKEGERLEKIKADSLKKVKKFKAAHLDASDLLTTSTGSYDFPFKSVSTIQANLKAKGYKQVSNYGGGYTYSYNGTHPGTGASYYCEVNFSNYGMPSVTFGSSSDASSFANKVYKFLNKTINAGGYTYTLGDYAGVWYSQSGNTIYFQGYY